MRKLQSLPQPRSQALVTVPRRRRSEAGWLIHAGFCSVSLVTKLCEGDARRVSCKGKLARIENFIFLRQGHYERMTLDFWSSCVHLPRARMSSMCQQTWFMWCWGTDSGCVTLPTEHHLWPPNVYESQELCEGRENKLGIFFRMKDGSILY